MSKARDDRWILIADFYFILQYLFFERVGLILNDVIYFFWD